MLNFIAVTGLWCLTCYASYRIGFNNGALAMRSLMIKLLATAAFKDELKDLDKQ